MDLQDSIRQHPELAPWWEAQARGAFVLPTCGDCGRAHWYPRAHCPHCHGRSITFQPSEGRGTIYALTLSAVHPTPTVVAYVELAEGPRILCNIVSDTPETLKIGDAVRLASSAVPSVPVFTPEEPAA